MPFNPVKIIGGTLIVLGIVFRAISVAYFQARMASVPPCARRLWERKRRNALWIDAGIALLGFSLLLAR